jgi:hypothetical protein
VKIQDLKNKIKNLKLRNKIFYSILFSLLVHLVFLFWSYFLKIHNYPATPAKPEKLIQIKLSRDQNVGQDSVQMAQRGLKQTLNPESMVEPAETTEKLKENEAGIKKSMETAVSEQKEAPVTPDAQNLEDAKRPQLKDNVVTRNVVRSTRKNLVDVGDMPQKDFTAGAPVVVSGDNISQNFLDKSNASLSNPVIAPLKAVVATDGFKEGQRVPSGLERKINASTLGAALTYQLFTFQDPKGQKYFKLVVKVKDATVNLPIIPKEIVFLVDASQSIGEERFKQFIDGVEYSLNHLNTGDRFNVIVFKDKAALFSPTSILFDPYQVRNALTFIKQFKSGSKTDIYVALNDSLQLANSIKPSYRILLSDGLPTKGVTDSRQVINQIADFNNGKICIFSYGGGLDVSRYLMDFLAYKNRGWSKYAEREYFIARDFAKLYNEIKDPLLLNLRYQTSGLNKKEMFPQILPDFFKGSEFVVYGTYTNETKFSMRILGNVTGETKEFILHANLKDATQGDKDIAHQWAFHKVYHLIGELKHDEKNNEALIKDIDSLCDQFGIITPYSRNFRK